MIPQIPLFVLTLAFAALPSSVDAALGMGPNVKYLDRAGFLRALKEERTFLMAYVAPWCGHCQKLAPELRRTADGLYPLVPVYAVDCDNDKNKPLCAEQGVKGFPTIKLYPQGKNSPSLEFEGTRTASSLFYWASRAVPSKISRTQTAKGVADIVVKNPGKPKAVLMNKSNKTPLLWKVLSSKYGDKIVFGNCRDRKGKVSVEMGFEAGEQSKQKLLVYGRDDKEPILYEGTLKFAALSEFFDQVLDGSVDVSRASLNAKEELLKVPESERQSLDDETRIGDAGYGGFNPHEGLDMEDLLKHGMNPHAAGHPGAGNAHGAGHAGAKAAHEAASSKSAPSSSPPKASSSSSKAEASAAKDTGAPAKAAATEKPVEHVKPSAEPSKESAEPTEHAKDEL